MKCSTLTLATACAAIAWLCWDPANVCQAQNPAPGLSPDLQEVVKLTQAKMGDDVIKNYINSTGKTYRLSADDIIYLNSQGVSPGVISALQMTATVNPNPPPTVPTSTAPPPPTAPAAPAGDPQYAPPPPPSPMVAPDQAPPPPPAPEVNFQYFHDQLAPWGVWINLPGVGMVWKPGDAVIAASPGWRPYYDNGQWVQTDNGLYWQSDYTWGDIPFHYGRWMLNPVYGWVWVPDYVWGPAWVFWRHDEMDGAVGWAPLPVGAVFVDGVFMFRGVRVGLDFDFGLGEDCFVFVDGAHFNERFFRLRGHEWRFHVDRARLHGFFGHSVVRNEFHRDEHGRFVNDGIGRDRMARLNNRVERASFEERHPVGDREKATRTMADNRGGVNRNEPNRNEPNRGESGGLAHNGGGGTAGTSRAGDAATGRAGGSPGGVSKVFRPPVSSGGSTSGQRSSSSAPPKRDK